MPRCVGGRCPAATLAIACLLALPAASPAQVQPRTFNAQTLRGVLVVTQPPDITMNGKPARLSPGARIVGADNMMQMSAALVGQRLTVHYTLEPLGLVHRVWVLTEEEAARRPWPTTAEQLATWSFDNASQTWTRR